MKHAFSYEKWSTIQALRFHFLSRPEIRILIVLANVYTIVAAVLLYLKYVRPEPFFLGVIIWLIIMGTYWFALPYYLFSSSRTFKENYVFQGNDDGFVLENERGEAVFGWDQLSHFLESPRFVHLYFNARSFFLVPKPADDAARQALIQLLQTHVHKK